MAAKFITLTNNANGFSIRVNLDLVRSYGRNHSCLKRNSLEEIGRNNGYMAERGCCIAFIRGYIYVNETPEEIDRIIKEEK